MSIKNYLLMLPLLGSLYLGCERKSPVIDKIGNPQSIDNFEQIGNNEEKGFTFLMLNERKREYNLKKILARYPEARPYLSWIEEAVKESENVWYVDEVLFLGLMKKESDFSPDAISSVGAAGICQFMPGTAEEIARAKGKKNEWGVYYPDYFDKGFEFYKKANSYNSLAQKYFDKLNMKLAEKYKRLSISYRKDAEAVFSRYKKELTDLTKGKSKEELIKIHWPFHDSLAIFGGVEHLAEQMESRKGDVREALSAYNAGLGNVNKAEGIPCIYETVNYQNRIVNFWKYWSPILEKKTEVGKETISNE